LARIEGVKGAEPGPTNDGADDDKGTRERDILRQVATVVCAALQDGRYNHVTEVPFGAYRRRWMAEVR
jgi:hypothetical protein